MKYLQQLNKILTRNQKKTAIFLTFLTFIAMILEILTLNIMLILLSYMSDPSSLSNSKFFIYLENLNFDYDFNLVLICLFVSSFTLKTFFYIFKSWKEAKFIYFTRSYLSHVFFKGYLYLPRIFHLRSNTSDLIKNITVEIDVLTVALLSVMTIAMETVVLLGVSIFLLFISLKLAIVCFLLLTAFSFLMTFANQKKIIQMGKDRVRVLQLRLKSIIEGLSGSKIFELTGSRKNLLGEFDNSNIKFAKLSHNLGFRNALPRPSFELFVLLIVGSIFIFTYQDQSKITSMLPTLGVFLAAAYRLIPSFVRITESIQKFQFHIQSAEKLSRDMKKFESIQFSSKDQAAEIRFNNSVDFKNVSFSYYKNTKKESNFVLRGVNFKINKGSKIGIFGVSGSGKSTFLDLFMGLISPQSGEILIDGKKIKNIKSSWQKIIGCVPQDVFILDDTIKRNVAFGLKDPAIDVEKVKKAIELANLNEFLKNSKFGLETLLGEAGSRLSGGQRQRIGIARALYNEPDILILDEATNALDVQTEKKIVNEIFLKKEDKTIIFVSHNRDNLIFCDLIYEVKEKNFSKVN